MPRPRHLFAGALLASQLVLPLSWYLGEGDPRDARFAWRMFSRSAAVACAPTYYVDGVAVDPLTRVGEAWAGPLRLGKRRVLTAVGRHLCAPGRLVTADVPCRDAVTGEVFAIDLPDDALCPAPAPPSQRSPDR